MKILMMGTGPFAVPTFESLIQSQHDVLGLVTRPDKLARGRRKAPPNPMRESANLHQVEVHAPQNINSDEGLAILDECQADLLVVCDYGQILSRVALGKARCGGINLHGSLLPKYRGAAPIQWALLHGDKIAGISVIHMTPRLDGGPVLCQRSLEVLDHENAAELEPRLSNLGVEAVHAAIAMLTDWDGQTVLGEPQNPDDVTKAPRLKKSDGQIDWTQSALSIYNRIRAFQPWPGTYTQLVRDGGKEPLRVIITRAIPDIERELEHQQPGCGRLVDDEIIVSCGQGVLRLANVQPAGKREMAATEFARGYGAEVQFHSPEDRRAE